MQRSNDLLKRSAGKVGASDGAGKQRVAGDELVLRREVKADAAFGMSRGMKHIGAERARSDRVGAANALVDFDLAGSGHADPGSLHVQHFEQSKVVLVEQNGGAGGGAQLHGSAHVIDVSVSDDDLLEFEIMLGED